MVDGSRFDETQSPRRLNLVYAISVGDRKGRGLDVLAKVPATRFVACDAWWHRVVRDASRRSPSMWLQSVSRQHHIGVCLALAINTQHADAVVTRRRGCWSQ
jgi:acyl CoA:acetate/3-ketoacid CoA transferase